MINDQPPPSHEGTAVQDEALTLVGLGGMALLALNGFAGGFDHTVQLAHLNGAGAYWDISVAASIEVLAIVGTVLLVLFHRRGWPTWAPSAVIVLGVVTTLGAQIAYRAAPDPNRFLGYVVAVTPTIATLLALLVGHLWYEYSRASATTPDGVTIEPAVDSRFRTPVEGLASPPTSAQDPGPEVLPTPAALPAPAPTPPAVSGAPTPEPDPPTRPPVPRPVSTTRVARTPDTPVQAAVRNVLEAALDAAEADQLEVVRRLPRGKTGRPSVAAIREALKVGQTKAQELRDEAFPDGNEERKGKSKILKVEGNATVIERNSHVDKEGKSKNEGKKKGEGTNTTSVDQGSARPAAGPEPTALRVVSGGRA